MLVTPTGRLIIIDFGTAKDLTGESKFNVRDFVGTPEYMAPEGNAYKYIYDLFFKYSHCNLLIVIEKSLREEQITTNADLWAFGCIVFQLIQGRNIFQGNSPFLTMRRYMI